MIHIQNNQEFWDEILYNRLKNNPETDGFIKMTEVDRSRLRDDILFYSDTFNPGMKGLLGYLQLRGFDRFDGDEITEEIVRLIK